MFFVHGDNQGYIFEKGLGYNYMLNKLYMFPRKIENKANKCIIS